MKILRFTVAQDFQSHIWTFACLRPFELCHSWFKHGICQLGFLGIAFVFFEMTDSSFVLVGDEEERFFGLDAESIPESDDSGGVNQHLTESYDPTLLLRQKDDEENVNSKGYSSSQLPITRVNRRLHTSLLRLVTACRNPLSPLQET